MASNLSELLKQVRRIEIRTRRLVAETFGGQYRSIFKGRGMEFAEVREYVPGDDVRTIDWNVSAKTGRPHVRRYQDERELTVILACDMSGSLNFGTDLKLKREIGAEIAAVLAFSALRNNDKTGLLLFSDEPELYIPPKRARSHALSLIRDLLAFEPRGRGTSISAALDALQRMLKRRSIVFLLSDFLDRGFERALRRCAIRHDLVCVSIEDPRESELPRLPAWLELQDPETGRSALVNAAGASGREALRRRREALRAGLERELKSGGIDCIRIRTDRPYADPLVRFFRERAKRLR